MRFFCNCAGGSYEILCVSGNSQKEDNFSGFDLPTFLCTNINYCALRSLWGETLELRGLYLREIVNLSELNLDRDLRIDTTVSRVRQCHAPMHRDLEANLRKF